MAVVEKDGIIVGNVYNKYEARNPIVRILMRGFLKSFVDALSRIEFGTVLEIGSGEGYITEVVKNINGDASILASDISIDIVKESIKQDENVSLALIDVHNIPLKKSTFDLIVCSEVLEHLPETQKPLEELERVAQKYILFSVPREPVWRFLNLMRLRYLRELGNTPGHIQHWSKKQFVEIIGSRFNIVKIYSPLPWTIILCEKR